MDYTFTSQVVFLDRSVRAAVFFMMYYLLLTYAYCLILVHVRKYFSAITSLIFKMLKSSITSSCLCKEAIKKIPLISSCLILSLQLRNQRGSGFYANINIKFVVRRYSFGVTYYGSICIFSLYMY
jgi:hypothetical protein